MAVYHGQEAEIRPPQAACLAYALATAWPRTVNFSDLAYALWGNFEPEGMAGSIRTHVCLARKPLKRLGLSIQAVEGRGYRLVRAEEMALA